MTQTDAVPKAQVTVRRSRLARDAALAAAEAGVHSPGPAHDDPAKGPRIFRVTTAADGPTPAPEPRPPGTDPSKQRTRATRRIAADKRPGAVVQVFQAPPAAPRTVPVGDLRLHRIGEHLAPVDRLLDEVARAQSFHFGPSGFAKDWQAMGLRVEQLRAVLRRLLRGAGQ